MNLEEARKKYRIWFWKPQWYWFGPRTLVPFMIGHDEYARRTLLLGWTVTGRAIIPLWDCGDEQCRKDALIYLQDEEWYETHGTYPQSAV